MYKSAVVFCGSKTGNDDAFMQTAITIGELLAKHSIQLIYGGGKVGMMGAVANAVLNNGGNVIGIIPEVLLAWEQQHQQLTELKVVPDMHTRKKLLYELADIAIILPGGNGTLDELFEMITWNTLKIHEKKIIIVNTNNYYQHLLAHLDTMLVNGFSYEDWRNRITVVANATDVISFLNVDKT
jgi:uncharacterized protein (TIGR00730 family)